MTRQPLVARRAEELIGASVVATAPVAGGDVSTATKLRLSTGQTAIVKTLNHAPSGFFEREAAGLRWLGEVPGGVPVPEVLGVDEECLVLAWVEPGRSSGDAAAEFGRTLAVTHAAGSETGTFGAEQEGFIGRLPLPNRPAPTWAEFYAVRRLLPYLKLASDRGAVEPEDAAAVEAVVPRLTALLPEEPPARLHGDLWNGNVVWGQDPAAPGQGRAHVIDPAAHAGHREVDLAMLALFGLPHLARVLEGYQEVAPLAEGWEDRIGLHQLFPLLVHACLFGGRYGARAAEVARRYH
ncbi:fructosamine kinase family protein [Nocardioides nanhaiensis]|uniref:Fructosamine kinase family protein n=1 Tax=Nocardioides nanhaiensis TaxID=1476871 RepID=A0ABP8VR69_9ACTN